MEIVKMASVCFANQENAAREVWRIIPALGPDITREYSLRPFNRFDPQWTEWWIIPSKSEWPAYRCSKLFIGSFPPPGPPGKSLFAGYYVEKGLDHQLSDMVQSTQIMKSDWYWHQFLQDIVTNDFIESIDEVCKHSGHQPHLWIDIHEFNKVPKVDATTANPYDSFGMLLSREGIISECIRPGKRLLADLNTSENLEALRNRLKQLKDLSFFWLDLHIGIPLDLAEEPESCWDEKAIWRNCLRPWLKWVSEYTS